MKPILILMFALLLCSWGEKKKVYIKGFIREIWIKDSMGCLSLRSRYGLCDTLFCNREKLFGLNDKEILEFLGKPSRSYVWSSFQYKTAVTTFDYYIENGEQCDQGYKEDDRGLDIKTLCIYMKNGIVYHIDIASGGAWCK